jgi:hypothetical protein
MVSGFLRRVQTGGDYVLVVISTAIILQLLLNNWSILVTTA